jgi:DNA-binding LacI/PurR family transcriptional regulator
MSALDLVIELAKLGKRVPEDISILGNHKKKSLPSLGLDLSSFETPWYEMGRKAAEYLIATPRNNCSERTIQEVLKQKFYNGNTIKRLNK